MTTYADYSTKNDISRFGQVASAGQSPARAKLIGDSSAMWELHRLIDRVGPSSASVLLVGESGTGKELVARRLHELSRRPANRFVALNCGAIPETLIESELFGHEKGAFTGAQARKPGCFELAHGGTLFLDELAAMPIASQVKLLRVLEEQSFRRLRGTEEVAVDVRVLAAMNESPERALEEGRLRRDLYYRLNVFTLRLPPLRERSSDIPALVDSFLEELGAANGKRVNGVDREAMSRLVSYDWPGNVRELRNVIERAVILEQGEALDAKSLSIGSSARNGARSSSRASSSGLAAEATIAEVGMTVEEASRRLILETLESTGYNQTKAAEILGISAKTIYNKLRQWGVDRRVRRDSAPAESDPPRTGWGSMPVSPGSEARGLA